MIPPREDAENAPFLLLLNGSKLVPLNLSWAILLSGFMDRLEPFAGLEITESDWNAMAAGAVVKVEGGKNDLLDRIAADSAFGVTREELEGIMKPENFVGRAPQQTQEFVDNEIQPILDKYSDLLGLDVEIKV